MQKKYAEKKAHIPKRGSQEGKRGPGKKWRGREWGARSTGGPPPFKNPFRKVRRGQTQEIQQEDRRESEKGGININKGRKGELKAKTLFHLEKRDPCIWPKGIYDGKKAKRTVNGRVKITLPGDKKKTVAEETRRKKSARGNNRSRKINSEKKGGVVPSKKQS